jgi:transposase-like protein
VTEIEDKPAEPAAAGQPAGQDLEVAIARDLLEQAKASGVSLAGPGGLLAGVTRRVLQAALDAEMTDHLGYEKGDRAGRGSGNHRNGTSAKTVLTEIGPVPLDVPRDRKGEFEPLIVPKHARRVEGFNEAIVSLYARGLTTGEIRGHLGEIYGVEVSRDLISRVTDRVTDELAAWQSRPLDRIYPVVLIDAIYVKIRDGQVANRPVYVALGINCQGERDVVGLWAGTGGKGGRRGGALAVGRNGGVGRLHRRVRRAEGPA